MKYTADRPYSDPEKAARRLMEHARAADRAAERRRREQRDEKELAEMLGDPI
jgi:hypothetical protein